MTKYRKKPVVIEAVQWDGENITEVVAFLTGTQFASDGSTGIVIQTLEGNMTASIGDYIIKGVQNEFYPCKPDIFDKTYEKTE